jgi:predicted RNA-binding protein with PUA-like domain
VQVRELKRQITLEELKSHKAGALSSMALFTTARLSVQPVSQAEWDCVRTTRMRHEHFCWFFL